MMPMVASQASRPIPRPLRAPPMNTLVNDVFTAATLKQTAKMNFRPSRRQHQAKRHSDIWGICDAKCNGFNAPTGCDNG